MNNTQFNGLSNVFSVQAQQGSPASRRGGELDHMKGLGNSKVNNLGINDIWADVGSSGSALTPSVVFDSQLNNISAFPANQPQVKFSETPTGSYPEAMTVNLTRSNQNAKVI